MFLIHLLVAVWLAWTIILYKQLDTRPIQAHYSSYSTSNTKQYCTHGSCLPPVPPRPCSKIKQRCCLTVARPSRHAQEEQVPDCCGSLSVLFDIFLSLPLSTNAMVETMMEYTAAAMVALKVIYSVECFKEWRGGCQSYSDVEVNSIGCLSL